MPDRGAQNLIRVFLSVVALLGAFYGYLAWRALNWNPMFFIRNEDSERSRLVWSAGADQPANPGHPSVRRGEDLYLRVGCALCHGLVGKGGIKNPNYIKGTTPALNTLAERMFLYASEDVEILLNIFDSGKSLEGDQELEVPRAGAVAAQYESVRRLIASGNPAGKKDPFGHAPLDMPPWVDRLSEAEINDLIAYLLSLYPWDQQ